MAIVLGHRPLVLVALLVSFVMAMAATRATAAVNCGQVARYIGPCRSYVVSGGNVPPSCCSGIRALNNAAKSTADRQAACRCLKSLSKGIKGLSPSYARSLPGKCGVNTPYSISPSIDCSRVH